MKKTTLKWILTSLGIAMIPALILGASQGGIALTPIILLGALIIGVVGAVIHVNIYAYTIGTKKQKFIATLFAVVVAISLLLLMLGSTGCDLTEEYAIERATEYVRSKPEFEIKYLNNGVFDHQSCMCTFEYFSPTKSFSIYVTEYGKLHSSSNYRP